MAPKPTTIGWGRNIPTPAPPPPLSTFLGSLGGIQAPAPSGMSAADQSVWAQIQTTLQQYGFSGSNLSALVAWAQQEIIAGKSTDQIALDMMQTPQFKQRFPAIGLLSAQGVAITPAEYISMEQSYAQAEQQAGITPNFASYDQLIANQVSPSEYSTRLTQGYLAVAASDQNVVNQFQQMYGISKAQLAQYFLNPKNQEPLLLKQALAAQIGAAGVESGWSGAGSLAQQASGAGAQPNTPVAQLLAQQGVTQQEAQQGFAQLAHQQQLTQGLPGQAETYQFTGQNLAEAAVGIDAQTELQLQLRAELEKNQFAGGVGAQSNQQGEVGTGSVQR